MMLKNFESIFFHYFLKKKLFLFSNEFECSGMIQVPVQYIYNLLISKQHESNKINKNKWFKTKNRKSMFAQSSVKTTFIYTHTPSIGIGRQSKRKDR